MEGTPWSADGATEFAFTTAYAGGLPTAASTASTASAEKKVPPKKRGFSWLSCFAPSQTESPLQKTAPSQKATPQNRLAVTGDGTLVWQHPGNAGQDEVTRVPLASVDEAYYKWVQAGGVRVAKVVLVVQGQPNPIIIRGLQEPQALLDAINAKWREQEAHGQPGDAATQTSEGIRGSLEQEAASVPSAAAPQQPTAQAAPGPQQTALPPGASGHSVITPANSTAIRRSVARALFPAAAAAASAAGAQQATGTSTEVEPVPQADPTSPAASLMSNMTFMSPFARGEAQQVTSRAASRAHSRIASRAHSAANSITHTHADDTPGSEDARLGRSRGPSGNGTAASAAAVCASSPATHPRKALAMPPPQPCDSFMGSLTLKPSLSPQGQGHTGMQFGGSPPLKPEDSIMASGIFSTVSGPQSHRSPFTSNSPAMGGAEHPAAASVYGDSPSLAERQAAAGFAASALLASVASTSGAVPGELSLSPSPYKPAYAPRARDSPGTVSPVSSRLAPEAGGTDRAAEADSLPQAESPSFRSQAALELASQAPAADGVAPAATAGAAGLGLGLGLGLSQGLYSKPAPHREAHAEDGAGGTGVRGDTSSMPAANAGRGAHGSGAGGSACGSDAGTSEYPSAKSGSPATTMATPPDTAAATTPAALSSYGSGAWDGAAAGLGAGGARVADGVGAAGAAVGSKALGTSQMAAGEGHAGSGVVGNVGSVAAVAGSSAKVGGGAAGLRATEVTTVPGPQPAAAAPVTLLSMMGAAAFAMVAASAAARSRQVPPAQRSDDEGQEAEGLEAEAPSALGCNSVADGAGGVSGTGTAEPSSGSGTQGSTGPAAAAGGALRVEDLPRDPQHGGVLHAGQAGNTGPEDVAAEVDRRLGEQQLLHSLVQHEAATGTHSGPGADAWGASVAVDGAAAVGAIVGSDDGQLRLAAGTCSRKGSNGGAESEGLWRSQPDLQALHAEPDDVAVGQQQLAQQQQPGDPRHRPDWELAAGTTAAAAGGMAVGACMADARGGASPAAGGRSVSPPASDGGIMHQGVGEHGAGAVDNVWLTGAGQAGVSRVVTTSAAGRVSHDAAPYPWGAEQPLGDDNAWTPAQVPVALASGAPLSEGGSAGHVGSGAKTGLVATGRAVGGQGYGPLPATSELGDRANSFGRLDGDGARAWQPVGSPAPASTGWGGPPGEQAGAYSPAISPPSSDGAALAAHSARSLGMAPAVDTASVAPTATAAAAAAAAVAAGVAVSTPRGSDLPPRKRAVLTESPVRVLFALEPEAQAASPPHNLGSSQQAWHTLAPRESAVQTDIPLMGPAVQVEDGSVVAGAGRSAAAVQTGDSSFGSLASRSKRQGAMGHSRNMTVFALDSPAVSGTGMATGATAASAGGSVRGACDWYMSPGRRGAAEGGVLGAGGFAGAAAVVPPWETEPSSPTATASRCPSTSPPASSCGSAPASCPRSPVSANPFLLSQPHTSRPLPHAPAHAHGTPTGNPFALVPEESEERQQLLQGYKSDTPMQLWQLPSTSAPFISRAQSSASHPSSSNPTPSEPSGGQPSVPSSGLYSRLGSSPGSSAGELDVSRFEPRSGSGVGLQAGAAGSGLLTYASLEEGSCAAVETVAWQVEEEGSAQQAAPGGMEPDHVGAGCGFGAADDAVWGQQQIPQHGHHHMGLAAGWATSPAASATSGLGLAAAAVAAGSGAAHGSVARGGGPGASSRRSSCGSNFAFSPATDAGKAAQSLDDAAWERFSMGSNCSTRHALGGLAAAPAVGASGGVDAAAGGAAGAAGGQLGGRDSRGGALHGEVSAVTLSVGAVLGRRLGVFGDEGASWHSGGSPSPSPSASASASGNQLLLASGAASDQLTRHTSPTHTSTAASPLATSAVPPAASPQLSEISSTAYATGSPAPRRPALPSPFSSPGLLLPHGSTRSTPANSLTSPQAAHAAAGGGDDLFMNPLYATPTRTARDPSLHPAAESGDFISLPVMPLYYDAQRSGGSPGYSYDGGSAMQSAAPSPSSPTHSKRRRSEPASPLGGPESAVTDCVTRTAGGGAVPDVGAAAAGHAVDGSGWQGADGAVNWGAAGNGGEVGGGSTDTAPRRRTRSRMPDGPTLVGALEAAAAAEAPAPSHLPLPPGLQGATPQPAASGAGQRAAHIPSASPLMVLNPAYTEAETETEASAASLGAAAAASTAADRGVAGAVASHWPRPCTLFPGDSPAAGVVAGISATGVTAAAGSRASTPAQGAQGASRGHSQSQSLSQSQSQCTPKRRRHKRSGRSTCTASPSSQQAVQATCLLRHANDAVEEARAAVTRGDAAWLARVAETLAAVQAAVDALHDFK